MGGESRSGKKISRQKACGFESRHSDQLLKNQVRKSHQYPQIVESTEKVDNLKKP